MNEGRKESRSVVSVCLDRNQGLERPMANIAVIQSHCIKYVDVQQTGFLAEESPIY